MNPRVSLCLVALVILVLNGEVEGWRRRRRRRCPVTNCAVSNWSPWSSCTLPCGTGGQQIRTRKVTKQATCGGSCSAQLKQSRACNIGCSGRGIPHKGRCDCKTGYSGRCCTGGMCVIIVSALTADNPLVLTGKQRKTETLRGISFASLNLRLQMTRNVAWELRSSTRLLQYLISLALAFINASSSPQIFRLKAFLVITILSIFFNVSPLSHPPIPLTPQSSCCCVFPTLIGSGI